MRPGVGMPSKPGGSRLGNFDTLRLVFAILVIFSHSFALGLGSIDREPLFRVTHTQFTFGNIGVLAFFVISGYLITQSWIRHASPVEYLQRRVARIYPAFIMRVDQCFYRSSHSCRSVYLVLYRR